MYTQLAGRTSGVEHKWLGGVVGVGPVAVGGPGLGVGLVQQGLEHCPWLAEDTAPPSSLGKLGLRLRLLEAFGSHHATAPSSTASAVTGFTPLQLALSSLLMSYADLAYLCETHENHVQIIQCYMLHALNHVYRCVYEGGRGFFCIYLFYVLLLVIVK